MCWTDDPVSDFLAHDKRQNRWLEQRPKCDYCEEHIQDDFYYEKDGEVICHDCMEAYFRKEIDE